jgi:hypothetical protein
MKSTIIALAMSVVALPALAQSTRPDPVFKNFNDLKWEKTTPSWETTLRRLQFCT